MACTRGAQPAGLGLRHPQQGQLSVTGDGEAQWVQKAPGQQIPGTESCAYILYCLY